MEFLTVSGSYEALGEAWKRYTEYLRSVQDVLPPDVAAFAGASWRYGPFDHRSLHDAWVESVRVTEGPTAGAKTRHVDIEVTLLGPFHDGHTTLSYADVTRYDLRLNHSSSRGPEGHEDWLIDEIRVSPTGGVIHEVVFSSGGSWLIECATIRHATTAPAISG